MLFQELTLVGHWNLCLKIIKYFLSQYCVQKNVQCDVSLKQSFTERSKWQMGWTTLIKRIIKKRGYFYVK